MVRYKIVSGYSVELHVLVRKRDVSKDFEKLVDYDLRTVEGLTVELVGSYETWQCTAHETYVTGVNGNEVVCQLPNDLPEDVYALRLSWTKDISHMQCVERGVVQVVTYNGQTRIPLGVQEGEPGGLLDLRYYIVTDNQSQCRVHWILDNVTCDREDMTMKNGDTLEATLKAALGYEIGRVTVVMNGEDVTAEVFDRDSGNVVIAAVSGWVTVTARGDLAEAFCGASAACDVAALNLEELEKRGVVAGTSVTVTTTEEKPVVWIVTRRPVRFAQGGLDAAMHSRRVGDLWYYWSDELTAGSNVYEVKDV